MAEDATSVGTNQVLMELAAERARQVLQHGRTPDQDDQRTIEAWAHLLLRRAVDLSSPFKAMVGDDDRRLLLEIAAISVAAIEALDRRSDGA